MPSTLEQSLLVTVPNLDWTLGHGRRCLKTVALVTTLRLDLSLLP